MPDAPFELKRWLDQYVVPHLAEAPPLELHSVLVNQPPGAARPEAVLVWALSKTGAGWAPAVKRLLEKNGFSVDFTRAPTLVALAPGKTITLFGGDGMPFIGSNGMAMARLFRRGKDGVDLIFEVGHRFEKITDATAAVRQLFQQFSEDPTALLARHTPSFGGA